MGSQLFFIGTPSCFFHATPMSIGVTNEGYLTKSELGTRTRKRRVLYNVYIVYRYIHDPKNTKFLIHDTYTIILGLQLRLMDHYFWFYCNCNPVCKYSVLCVVQWQFLLYPGDMIRLVVRDFSTEASGGIPLDRVPPWKTGRRYNRGLRGNSLRTNRYCPPPHFWNNNTMTILVFLWWFSWNFHKIQKYIVKFRGLGPQLHFIWVSLYSYFEFNNILFRFIPDQAFNRPVP